MNFTKFPEVPEFPKFSEFPKFNKFQNYQKLKIFPFSSLFFKRTNKLIKIRADLSLSKKLCKSYKGGRFGLLK